MADWQVIRQEYEQGASLRRLAVRHGVSKSLIGKKKFEEQWTASVDSGQPQTEPQQSATPRKKTTQEIFLEAFAIHGNVTQACRAAYVDRSTLYRWKEHDEQFLLLYHQAFEEAKDNIRAEIYRRAHDGVEEPVLAQGQIVYEYEPVLDEAGQQRKDEKGKPMWQRGKMVTNLKYSDTLLIFHAKMLMPEYREKSTVDVNTTNKTVEIYKVRIPDNGRNE